MADLREILATGKLKLYSQNYSKELSEELQQLEVKLSAKRVKFTWKVGDDEYYCEQSNTENIITTTSRGRLCLVFANYTGLIWDDGISDTGGMLTLYGADAQGAPAPLMYNINWDISKDYVTDAPQGGNTPLGNTDLIHYLDLNLKYGTTFIFPYGDSWGIRGQNAEFYVDLPIFESVQDAEDYINTGDDSHAVNPHEPIPTDNDGSFLWYEYELDTIDKVSHKILQRGETQSAKFTLPLSTDLCAFVRIADNIYQLQCTNENVLAYNPETLKYDIPIPFSDVQIEIIDGIREDKLGDIYTNILPFVDDLSEFGDIQKNEDSYNGEDANMDLTEITVNGSFIGAYYLTGEEVNNIASILYTSDTDVSTALKEGLWMYSGNPVDSIIDLCFYPFDLTPFISQHATRYLRFGSFVYNGQLPDVPQTGYDKVTGTNQPFTLIDQRIIPIYNDFRDFNSVSYSLYIPYYGIVPLPNTVIGNKLKVVAYFDIFTAQLKYYIMVNNTILTVVECSVGRHMSVVGTNWITKSGQNINEMINAYTSAGNVAKGVGKLDAGGIIGGIGGMISATMNYLSKPEVTVAGNTSGGLNIYDPMSCYLIVEQYDTIKPANLNSEYGIPTYKIAAISSCHGFTQISDCKLKTRASEVEYNEILTLLKEGVII